MKHWRERFAILQNIHLAAAGHSARVDHRTLEAQGIDREPTVHLGPAATAIERRTGQASNVRQDRTNSSVAVMIEKARLERHIGKVSEGIAGIEQQLKEAKAEKSKETAKTEPPRRPEVEELPLNQQVQVWDATVEKSTLARQKRTGRISEKAHARYNRRQERAYEIRADKPAPPTGLFGVFKEKAYRANLQAWSIRSNRAEKLLTQADKLLDRLQDQYRNARTYVVGKIKDRFPEWANNVSQHKPVMRAEQLKKEAEEKQANRELKRGRDRGMSR